MTFSLLQRLTELPALLLVLHFLMNYNTHMQNILITSLQNINQLGRSSVCELCWVFSLKGRQPSIFLVQKAKRKKRKEDAKSILSMVFQLTTGNTGVIIL